MARNNVFRIYSDEEVMLRVYGRRLRMADADFDKREPELRAFIARYQNQPEEDQLTEEGHRVNVTSGIGVIDTMFSSMTAVDVEFITRRLARATEAQAIAATKALNQGWRDTRGQRRCKKAIKDALLTDIGWAKVYYDYIEDVETRDLPEKAIEAQVQELLAGNAKLTEAEVLELVKTTEDVDIVIRDRVCIDYVPWDMVRYDISAKNMEDVRWTAQYTKMPVPEVKLNPTWVAFVEDRYGQTEGRRLMEHLEGDSVITTGESYADVEGLGMDERSREDDARVTVVAMWDLETGLVTVFPKNRADLVLYQFPNPLMFNVDLIDRNPFKALVVREDPENVEGLGDMRVIAPTLEELDEYRTNIAEHVTRSIPKIFGPKDALGAQARKALESGEWMAYVGLDTGHTFQEIGSPPIPVLAQEVYNVPEKLQAEMM